MVKKKKVTQTGVEVELTSVIPFVAIGKRRHRGRSVILDSLYIKVSDNGDKGGSLDTSSVAEMVRRRLGPDAFFYV